MKQAGKNWTAEQRLRFRMVEAPSGCWIWLGSRDAKGYGQLKIRNAMWRAHRLSYETFVGPIPDGMQIDHLCRRKACIRPLHLEAVTPSVNVRRGTSPGARAIRTGHCNRGHSRAKFGFLTTNGKGMACRGCNRQFARESIERKRARQCAA